MATYVDYGHNPPPLGGRGPPAFGDAPRADRFELQRLLKQANGVESWRAYEPSSGKYFVLKRTQAGSLQGRLPLLHRELEALRLLDKVVEFGRSGNYIYLVRDFLPGETLADRLARGAFRFDEAIQFARRALAALETVHEAGIIHRDLKPSNLLLDPTGEAVALIDFGFSLDERETLSAAGPERMGTALYWAPEQAGTLARPVGPWSDLYSLGCVLFECLTGHPPFIARSTGELLRKHLNESPRSLRAINPAVPAALDAFVQHLLAKDPDHRYRSCTSALADLQQIEKLLAQRGPEAQFLVGLRDHRPGLADPSFVGRQHELGVLDAELARARQGRGGLVLLEGESGGGKTRLMREFAHGAGWTMFGQAVNEGAQRPFQVLSGVFASTARLAQEDPAFLERLCRGLGGWRDALADLVPELRPLLKTGRPRILGPEAVAEIRSIQALAALLDLLGTPERPAVIFLDDCQWADELSLKLISYWQQKSGEGDSAGRHTLVVAAFRTEEVGPIHRLRQLKHYTALTLQPFAASDVQAMAESMAGQLPAEACETVAALSAGNPFMASAVLQGLVESGALRPGPSGWEMDKAALHEVRASKRAAVFLARRLREFPVDVLPVLKVGAVLGKEFRLDYLGHLTAIPEKTLRRALAEAEHRKVIWAMEAGRTYSFVHDKIRETLLDLLDPEERRGLHLRAAACVAQLSPGHHYDLAYHFSEAGQLDLAFFHALEGAERARRQYSLQISEKYFRIAERGLIFASPVSQFRVLRGLAEVLQLQGKYPEADTACRSALELAPGPQERAAVRGQLGEIAFKRGFVAEAATTTEEAIRSLGHYVPRHAAGYLPLLAWEILVHVTHCLLPWLRHRRKQEPSPQERLSLRLYSRLAYIYWFGSGWVPCAWAHLRELNRAVIYPETLELAQAYSEHAILMTTLPWFGRGIRYVKQSLELRRRLGDVWGEGQSLHFLGVTLYGASRFQESIDACGEGVRVLERTGDRWEVNTANWHRAIALFRLGRLGEALDLSRQTYRAGVEIEDRQAAGLSLTCWAKATDGQVPAGLIEAELSRGAGDHHTRMELLQAQAICRLAQRDTAGAIASLNEADALVSKHWIRREYMAPIRPLLCTVLRRHADTLPDLYAKEKAATYRRLRITLWRALWISWFYRNNHPHACREMAYWHALHGKAKPARRWLQRSLAEAESQGATYEAALSREAKAEIGIALGWPEAERELLEARRLLAELRLPANEAEHHTESGSLSLLDRFSSLLTAGHEIATALDQQSLYAALGRSALSILRPERCLVLERRNGTLEAVHAAGEVAHDPIGAVSQSAVNRSLDLKYPVVLEDIAHASPHESVVLANARSVLCAPILVQGETVAFLYLSHDHLSGLFGETEVQLARFLATIGAAAWENAAGFARVQALSEERARLNEQASNALRMRDEFLTLASHELKTPLTSALLQCQMLLRRAADPEGELLPKAHAERSLRLSEKQLKQLKRLIDDLMNVAQINTGHFTLEKTCVDMVALVREVGESMRETCEGAGCDVRIGSLDPATAVVDRGRVAQVLSNLLVNATKYAPGAPIDLSLESFSDGVRVHVRDHGPGIPSEDQARIFERFERATLDKGAGGLGLGLYISTEILRGHGGRILLVSEPGRGCHFTIELPKEPA